jgi:hypothetical protein
VSNWVKDKDKTTYEFEVPQQSSAQIKLKKDASQKITVTAVSDPSLNPNTIKGLNEGNFDLSAGKYIVTVYNHTF